MWIVDGLLRVLTKVKQIDVDVYLTVNFAD